MNIKEAQFCLSFYVDLTKERHIIKVKWNLAEYLVII